MNLFEYAWLIPLLPLGAFAFITFFSPFYRNKNVSSGVAIGAMLLATILAWGVAAQGASSGFGPVEAVHAGAEAEPGGEATGEGEPAAEEEHAEEGGAAAEEEHAEEGAH